MKIICLSDKSDLDCVIKMINAGATGYVMKNSSIEELTNCIQVVCQGNSYFSKEVNLKLLANLKKSNNKISHRISDLPIPITDREFEILKNISEELTNKEIADRLVYQPPNSRYASPEFVAKTQRKKYRRPRQILFVDHKTKQTYFLINTKPP